MLQGSLYETLTSKINRLCNFSYQTCVDIILSGAPSNAPSFSFTKTKRKLSEKKHPVKKKKCNKRQEDEKLPDRYLMPDEL